MHSYTVHTTTKLAGHTAPLPWCSLLFLLLHRPNLLLAAASSSPRPTSNDLLTAASFLLQPPSCCYTDRTSYLPWCILPPSPNLLSSFAPFTLLFLLHPPLLTCCKHTQNPATTSPRPILPPHLLLHKPNLSCYTPTHSYGQNIAPKTHHTTGRRSPLKTPIRIEALE